MANKTNVYENLKEIEKKLTEFEEMMRLIGKFPVESFGEVSLHPKYALWESQYSIQID